MTSRAKALFDEALRLPADKREALATSLVESLEGEAAEVDEAWAAEIEGRAKRSTAGRGRATSTRCSPRFRAELRRGV